MKKLILFIIILFIVFLNFSTAKVKLKDTKDFCINYQNCNISSLTVGNLSVIEYTVLNHTTITNATVYDDLNVKDKINLTGDMYQYNGTIRTDQDSNFFFYDTTDEFKHLNSFAADYDELRANIFTELLNITTFINSTGAYIRIKTIRASRIRFVIVKDGDPNAESFDYNETVFPLVQGTDTEPVLNRIYVAYSGGVPAWFVTTSEPTMPHAMATRIKVGETRFYVGSLKEDNSQGFIKRSQRRSRKTGTLYEEGFEYTANSTDINVSSGNILVGNYDETISDMGLLSQSGFYTINSTGGYNWFNNLKDLLDNSTYPGGDSFGSNKYINIMVGISPYDGSGNYHLIVQNKPENEFTSVDDAYFESSTVLNIYPADTFEKIMYQPIARIIINTNTALIQQLPIYNTPYAEDYRGGLQGGAGSGGGISEGDPLSLHKDGSVTPTGDFDWGGYDMYNIDLLEVNTISNGTDEFLISDLNYTITKDNRVITKFRNIEVTGAYTSGVSWYDNFTFVSNNITDVLTITIWETFEDPDYELDIGDLYLLDSDGNVLCGGAGLSTSSSQYKLTIDYMRGLYNGSYQGVCHKRLEGEGTVDTTGTYFDDTIDSNIMNGTYTLSIFWDSWDTNFNAGRPDSCAGNCVANKTIHYTAELITNDI